MDPWIGYVLMWIGLACAITLLVVALIEVIGPLREPELEDEPDFHDWRANEVDRIWGGS